MRLNFSLILSLTTVCTVTYAKSGWNPQSALEYTSSFHSVIADIESSSVRSTLDPKCFDELRKQIRAGADFSSEKIRKNSRRVSESHSPQTRDGEFFHYTTQEKLKELAADKNFDPLFNFVRIEPGSKSREMYFYIADDSKSSKEYGPIQMKIKISKEALIYYPWGLKMTQDQLILEGVKRTQQGLIETEVIEKNPELKVCKQVYLSPPKSYYKDYPHYHTVLVTLAMEAEGVDLISYFGRSKGYVWYQVVGPWAIEDMTSDAE